MPYLTRYSLEWEIPEDMQPRSACDHHKPDGANFCPECGLPAEVSPDDAIGDYIEAHTVMRQVIYRDGTHRELDKWYDRRRHMAEMSREFPGVLFTLSGEGDAAEDLWVEYYLDGKCQVARARIAYSPFDPEKLEEVEV